MVNLDKVPALKSAHTPEQLTRILALLPDRSVSYLRDQLLDVLLLVEAEQFRRTDDGISIPARSH